MANSPDGDGSYFVEPLNGTKAREFEFWIDSGTWCVCVVDNFNIPEHFSDDGVAKIEIENGGNLCVKKYENMPKSRYYIVRYYIVSGSQDIAVIDFDTELDDDDWEDDFSDDD